MGPFKKRNSMNREELFTAPRGHCQMKVAVVLATFWFTIVERMSCLSLKAVGVDFHCTSTLRRSGGVRGVGGRSRSPGIWIASTTLTIVLCFISLLDYLHRSRRGAMIGGNECSSLRSSLNLPELRNSILTRRKQLTSSLNLSIHVKGSISGERGRCSATTHDTAAEVRTKHDDTSLFHISSSVRRRPAPADISAVRCFHCRLWLLKNRT